MPGFADGEVGSNVRGKINAVINAVEQGGLGRNRVINGGMRVDQRNSGAAQTITAGAALAYCVDRWYGYCTGANVTGQRVALANGQHRYRFTGAASVTGVGFGQRIEAANCLDLADGSAMLQVKAYSSSLTSLGWAVYYASTADSFGTLASPTRTLIASGTFTITSTEATYSASITMPSGAITGLEVVFTGGALLATQTLHIGDVQLEKGTVATSYERRLFGMETALCERYFQRITDPPLRGVFSSTTGADTLGMAITEMRATPVASISGTLTLYDGTNVGTITAILTQSNTSRHVQIAANRATGTFVANRPAIIATNAGSGPGYLNLTAEL